MTLYLIIICDRQIDIYVIIIITMCIEIKMVIKIIKHDNKIIINNGSRLKNTIRYIGIYFLFKNMTPSNHYSSLVL